MGSKWAKVWPPLMAMIAFLLVWQGAVFFFRLEKWFLPGPAAVVQEAISIWPRLWEHTAATIRLTLLGFSLGALTGIIVGGLLHLVKRVKLSVYPLLVLSQNIPIIALGPLLVMWFGFGLLPKVLLIILVCFFPISVAMMIGLANSDPRLMNYMQMIGANKWHIFRRLELPHALPYLFSGLKIAAAYSVTSAIVAEWLGSSKGLGYFMQLSSKGFMAPRVFAAVLITITLSMSLFGIIALAERWIIRWQPRKEGG
ncbi:ABC transporter permease [Paenibacillus abyssi]|uniref:Nitrate ABC transporter permease n=1 Tax=Paenibacillus abyssi TaxID=1340531 RepID=A0A917FXW8_9BACL|nr:ABC transporter permease [Paenibacillus abyssi]GGG12780.1 nitrate ABC transporter permease [Paenibacillus abyssi]